MHVCPECGAIDEQAQGYVDTINAQNDLIGRLQRTIRKLREERATGSPEEEEQAERVYAHWKRTLATSARVFSEERKVKVLARLRESYDADDLCRAVDGAAASHWHVSRGKTDLELICRTASHVDDFLARAPQAPPAIREALAAAANGNGNGHHPTEDGRPQLELAPATLVAVERPILGACGAAAIAYARQGWHVFPCHSQEKTPATNNGLLAAKTDEKKIADCWAAYPEMNVAIRTGRESRLVVLDVDGDAGMDQLRALEKRHEKLPVTYSVTTPRGGEHFYFLHPGDEVRNSAGWPAPGLDVRGDGGYVLAPPSVGPNGKSYEVDDEEEVRALPAWLLKLLLRRRTSGRRRPAEHWGGVRAHGAKAGERNDLLASYVGHLLGIGMEEPELRATVADWNRLHLRPALDETEVSRTVDSVIRTHDRDRAKATA